MRRIEDLRLLTGQGRFTDDLPAEGALAAAFVRSPYAHAELGPIETAAMAVPGARLVLTGADIEAASLKPIPVAARLTDADGKGPTLSPWPALAQGRVRHVGEVVALCVAETPAQALDMVERIAVDYRPLPVVIGFERALADNAEQIWPAAPRNVALHWTIGDLTATDRALGTSPLVVEVALSSQRLVIAPMEPRAVLASWHKESQSYHLQTGSQGALFLAQQMAAMMAVPLERMVVTHGDVGGAFGIRSCPYPEYAALLLAARRLGRPVRWTCTRSEAFLSDNQARDSRMTGRLALDRDGRILALEAQAVADMGAYLQPQGYFIACSNFARCLPGPYRVPAIFAEVYCVHTNTVSTAPYRGAGRPEAAFLMEALMDKAAHTLRIDAAEIRRRNMLAASELPHETGVDMSYDSGDFPALLAEALRAADYAGAMQRKEEARARGRLRGIGIGVFVELSGGPPLERAQMRIGEGGRVLVRTPLGASGQGHETVFAALAAAELGLSPEQVTVEGSDSRGLADGGATFGSRATAAGGHAIKAASAKLIETARARAAERLKVAPERLAWEHGRFTLPGTNHTVSLTELANLPGPPIMADTTATTPLTFPNGVHIAEVEIDPETGEVTLVSYLAADDCGRVVAPVLAEGQVHGAIAQGVGQVLVEHAIYDRESGQLVTGSFMDYAMPRADDLPFMRSLFRPAPATTNPLGVKGVGEAGTTGALPAVYNAIMDALAPFGVQVLALPATPERVWQAIKGASRA
jgi:carbon-monoxide dehydrogenase large subunit